MCEIKLPPEFISTNSTPVTVATIKRERMEEILREAVEADRKLREEQIIATYYDWLYRGQDQFDTDELNKREIELAQLAWEEAQEGTVAIYTNPQSVTQKGDMRLNDGKLWMCTDPDIDRWVCPDDRGWQLVPKKPTHEMLLAGKHTIKGADTTFEGILAEYAYLSMLEAAPKFGEELC